jgi:hypothetical protein
MIHYEGEGRSAGLSIQEAWANCGISPKDYDDLIRGLFLAAPKELSAHVVKKLDSRGYPLATTELTRAFDGSKVVAEDRGPVYAVWVH